MMLRLESSISGPSAPCPLLAADLAVVAASGLEGSPGTGLLSAAFWGWATHTRHRTVGALEQGGPTHGTAKTETIFATHFIVSL